MERTFCLVTALYDGKVIFSSTFFTSLPIVLVNDGLSNADIDEHIEIYKQRSEAQDPSQQVNQIQVFIYSQDQMKSILNLNYS